ncbi:MAG: sulfatase-like hydrolase/transferase, partial [Rubripirellula sp.]|nr:sulfatase-like hydrolase/transferase [Rubripirellula sp.]
MVVSELLHINRSQAAKSIAACFVCVLSTCPLMGADRPNIIFVLCDDLGAGDIGVLWQNGREGVQKFSTPNMDKFAREGMILNRHYCPAPSCMASRTSLMTGRHAGHSARRNFQFDAEIPDGHTLGSVLKKAGYATAAIGKWGMAGGPFQLSIEPVRGDRSPKTNPSHPTLRGFDYFYGYTAHRDAHYHYPKLGNRPLYDGFVDVTDRLAKCYSTDLLTARTKKWIVDHHRAHPKQPFFTYLCYTAPHAGLRIPTTSHLTAKGNYPAGGGLSGGVQWLDDAGNGQINTAQGAIDKGMHPEVAHALGDDGKPWPDHARRHATMVRRLDDALADLIQLLKDLKIDDRTIVVLTSDNGTLREAGLDKVAAYHPDYLDTFGRYDGIKLDLWEGGVRMPTIVRWPAVIEAGSESPAASQFQDWMATFCDLSGVPVPAVSDGVSMVPTLTGEGEQPRGTVYSEFLSRGATPSYVEFEASRRGQRRGQMQSMLIGEFKGIRTNIENHQSVFEVYHTLKDPKETVNLAGKPGAPTQQEFQAAVLRSRRTDPLAKRPYDDALIPALAEIATRPGLIRSEYPGNFDWVPQFDQREPSRRSEVIGLDATAGAQQFAAYLRVPKSGVYQFSLTTDGKAVVRLHDALLIDADSQYTAGSKAASGEIALLAGLHPIRISYLAGKDAAKLSLQWQVPGTKMKHIRAVEYRIARKNDLGAESGISAAQTAAAAFRIPEGFSIEVFAAKPQLINPVAICLDEQGRVYVAEDHRFLEGTPENRSHKFMLEDDLQITTLADRLAMQKKWAHKFDKGIDWFTQKSDIVRRLEDRDGDGRADVSRVFADGFDGPLDGLGSGLIARDGKVWYTCIPNLWLLEDKNGDGKAEDKKAILTGFGVNAAFYGHDLHGLVWGVDGKLYFSVGDRGAHVETKEGTTISNPRRGAVYRCNPDGTELERIHQGLRNPQELAIDQYGNVFADDNNCDKGDHSRLVYVVPGGDSGWNMAYQHIAEPYLTGPWHAEGMWHLEHDLQPAFIVPPVGKIGDGPSGFVFSSGTSLPPRYRNHFFYCNYKGNIGGVESFAVKEQGAGFTIDDHHDFCKPIKASDVDFGYDGKMYVADYPTSPFKRDISGGRIYTIFDKTRLSEPVITETRTLFQKGFRHRTTKELASLLHHDDMRVRLRAQFALAERGNASAEVFTGIAIRDDNQLARLHAIWGLGQIGRTDPTTKALAPVVALLDDADSEVRAQAARVLGDAHYGPAASAIVSLLADDTSRVRFFAALALGSLQSGNAVEPVISMLRENDGKDRYLTHAGVVALEQIGDRELLQQWAGDKSVAVRMAVLLVQRRWSDPRIAQFLDDAQLEIVTEAARAINDLPLTT